MFYKDAKIVRNLPNKIEVGGKVIFNPKWHHYQAAGWKEFPPELQEVENKYIKWIDGNPVEMSQEEKDVVDAKELKDNIKQWHSELWTSFQQNAYEQMDDEARHSINLMLVDPSTTPEQHQRILEYGAWWTKYWKIDYARERTRVLSGEHVVFDESMVDPCPYTIWEIVAP